MSPHLISITILGDYFNCHFWQFFYYNNSRKGDTMQIAAAYIRVSTDDQLEFSPDAQKRAITEYAKRNNMLLDEKYIFVDEGISGRKAEKRPAFMEMICTAKVKPKPFDIILVHKFDRFARNREDSVVYKSLLRKECGIKVISITEQLEDDKFSIILESMLEAMAEYYSLNLSDEVKKGMFEKARRGEHIGKAPYGYDIKDRQLVVNEYEFSVVQMMFDMFVNKGYSYAALSKYLNQNGISTKRGGKWRICTIKYILTNHLYTGLTRYNYMSPNRYTVNPEKEWILAEGSHTAAIDEHTFQKAQQKAIKQSEFALKNTKTTNIRTWSQHLICCAECGNRLVLHSSDNGKYFAYECISHSEGRCTQNRSWSNRKLEKLILETMKYDMQNPHQMQIETKTALPSNEISIIKHSIDKIQQKKELIKKAYLAEIDTLEEYKANKIELQKEEKELLKKLSLLEIQQQSPHDILNPKRLQMFYNTLISNTVSIAEKHNTATEFIQKVLLDLQNRTIQIIYCI